MNRFQDAGAQEFRASLQYPAKFLCGFASGEDSRLGAVYGHYNTIVKILATRDNTSIAFGATIVRSDLEVTEGEPSGYSQRLDLDAGEAAGILCADIKRELFDAGGQGFMDGIVTIYSSKLLIVKSVLTGENEGGHSLQSIDVMEIRRAMRITPVNNEA